MVELLNYFCQKISDMDFDTQIADAPYVPGVEYDDAGCPVGITVEEWMDKLGKKLITHYGDDFRTMLNQARAGRGLLPL